MKISKYKFDKFLLKHDTTVGVVLLLMTAFAVIGAIWIVGSIL